MTTCFDSHQRDPHGKVDGVVEVILSYYRDLPYLGCPQRYLLHVRRGFLAGAWRRLPWVERASQGLCQNAGPSQTHQGSSSTQSCLVQSGKSGVWSKCSSSQVYSPVEKREQLDVFIAPLSFPSCRLPMLLSVSVTDFPKSSHLNVVKLVSPRMHEYPKLFMKI